jgi:hypothetical protein
MLYDTLVKMLIVIKHSSNLINILYNMAANIRCILAFDIAGQLGYPFNRDRT